jgi:hypothetical protein
VLATANSVIGANTDGEIIGAARPITSVIGPGASARSRRGTTDTADQTERERALRLARLLGDINHVLEADKREEGEYGACMTRRSAGSPPATAGVSR